MIKHKTGPCEYLADNKFTTAVSMGKRKNIPSSALSRECYHQLFSNGGVFN